MLKEYVNFHLLRIIYCPVIIYIVHSFINFSMPCLRNLVVFDECFNHAENEILFIGKHDNDLCSSFKNDMIFFKRLFDSFISSILQPSFRSNWLNAHQLHNPIVYFLIKR